MFLISRVFFRRRDKKSKEDHPRSNFVVVVRRHVSLRWCSVSVDADVAVLRSGLRTGSETRVEFLLLSLSLSLSIFIPFFGQNILFVTFLFFLLFSIGPGSTAACYLREPGNARHQIHSHWRRDIRFTHIVKSF